MKNLTETLRVCGRPAPRPASDFWADFERRADGLVREGPARMTAPHALRWAAVAAALALLIGGAAWWVRPGPALLAAARPADDVRSLSVMTAHEGVFIMQDGAGQGTIIWIGGIPPAGNGG